MIEKYGAPSPDPNKPCVFPFKSTNNGKTYYECKENPGSIFWCRTNIQGTKWGVCGDNCRNHSSGIKKKCTSDAFEVN